MNTLRVATLMALDVVTQPNELDAWRLVRALARRRRYRYVHPEVRAIAGGYSVVSPCCSRNVDPQGGMIDIARMQRLVNGEWLAYAKDHEADQWMPCGRFSRLVDVIEFIVDDAERLFWK